MRTRIDDHAGKTYLTSMTTRIKSSTKGQIVLPKRTRDRLGIVDGTAIDVIDTTMGVELRVVGAEKEGTVEDALKRLRSIIDYKGPRPDEDDWQRGIESVIREKWGPRLK